MYNPPLASILKVFKKRGEKKLFGRKGQFQSPKILSPELQCIGLSSRPLKVHSKLALPYFMFKF
jgi:hypothetical protein